MIELAPEESQMGLTARQIDVLEILERTGSNRAVCAELGIGEVTLARILCRACAAAGVENRIQLLVKWIRWQWEREEGRAA